MPVSWDPVTAWVCGCRSDGLLPNPQERPQCHWGQVPALQLGLWQRCELELPGNHVHGEQWTGPENLPGPRRRPAAAGLPLAQPALSPSAPPPAAHETPCRESPLPISLEEQIKPWHGLELAV